MRAQGASRPRFPYGSVVVDGPPPRGLPTRVLSSVVRLYQLGHQGRVPSCRFLPTCSAYALEAIETYGAAKGSWLAVRRLARCHPLGGSGVDPVLANDSPANDHPRTARTPQESQAC